jgi:hypothetical protein
LRNYKTNTKSFKETKLKNNFIGLDVAIKEVGRIGNQP